MKRFIERMSADLRWLGCGGDGPWVKLWEYPLYALLGAWYVSTSIWKSTVKRPVEFFR